LIPEVILFALLVGWLAGGKFQRLADAKIKFGWMIFLPFGLYLVSLVPALLRLPLYCGISNIFERIVFLFVSISNWRKPGMLLITIGLLMNLAPILANGGMMPADPQSMTAAFGEQYVEQAKTALHTRSKIMDTTTELGFLCDIIAAKRPFVLAPAVYSVGDLVMSIGIFITIIALMRTPLPDEVDAPAKEAAVETLRE